MSRYGNHQPDQTDDESEYNQSSGKSVIGFRRKGVEEFLEIIKNNRHQLLRRSSVATRATLSLGDIS